MATVYGNIVNGYWRVYLNVVVNNSYSATQAKVSFVYGIDWVKTIAGDTDELNYWTSNDTTYVACTGETTKNYSPTKILTKSNTGSTSYQYASSYFIVDKGTSAKTVTLSASIYHNSNRTLYKGKSYLSTSASISAKTHYTVAYNANGGSGAPASQTKWYGTTLKLSSTKPTRGGYSFKNWNTAAGGGGTAYSPSGSYTANAGATLYAQWTVTNPPTCTAKPSKNKLIQGVKYNGAANWYDSINVIVTPTYKYTGRTIKSVQVTCLSTVKTITANQSSYTFTFTSNELTTRGTQNVKVVITDSAGASTTYTALTKINIVAPTWTKTVTFGTANDPLPLPPTDKNNYGLFDKIEAYNYTTNVYDIISKANIKVSKVDDDSWTATFTLDENHVYPKNNKVATYPDNSNDQDNHAIRVTYSIYTSDEPISGKAFYSTSRNQNYSNGIYNVMFVSGCDKESYPDYTSRVWWSKYNNPLYFPDLNYIEVGSNDTAVQGLTKVGDYLGVVKQSKTTDTAIFLLYPTSFEEDTTYAVKQGVQGVGALARYSFNILGDETLFLSPNGVMAIVPNQDEEHKTQNRSYFVDGKLLKESNLENAYSFVHDGKYFLAMGSQDGSVYVLDGNQRNSWGNDKTVLVYECYYLDNVPADCFVKYHDRLVFSNTKEVCMFNDGYIDAYDYDGNVNTPVKAEWSTIFDDDNALHYYKTMQKKGNLISILPAESEAEHSSTEVRIKKDDKDPVLIERSFGASPEIPSEMFFNKKFKKYKRLQFIITNNANENFGIDEIIKNYTIGNYAKK